MYFSKKWNVLIFSLASLPYSYSHTPLTFSPCSGKEIDSLWNNLLRSVPITSDDRPRSSKASFDPYDAKSDLESFIRKLRVPYDVVIRNRTSSDCILHIATIDNSESIHASVKIVKSKESYTLEQKGTRLLSVKLQNSEYFLNPKWSRNGQLQLFIETVQDRFFLHQYHDFSFEGIPFSEDEYNSPDISEEVKNWMLQFNGNLEFTDTALGKSEGLNLNAIEHHRRSLYAKYNIAARLNEDPLAIDRAENKIPLITHKVWVTSDAKPRSLPAHNLKYLENSILSNPTSMGWTHIIWIESKEKLPEFAKMIDAHPDITLMEIKDIDAYFISGDLYKKAIKSGQFGKASDILRLEILIQYGGYYLDTDYEVFQSLKPYSKVYDMVTGIEPMSAFLCNAFIGSRPDHPVLHKYLELIMRNLGYKDTPDYIDPNQTNGYKTIIETGPGVLTLSFALAGGLSGNIDIAMPPMLIFPTKYKAYPCKPVVTPNWPVPAESIGVHYWETSWMNAEYFGSNG